MLLLLPALAMAAADAAARPSPAATPSPADAPVAGQTDGGASRADEADTVVVNGVRVQDTQAAPDAQVGILGDRGVFDTPFSTSSYTGQLIKDQQARDISDVLANDPAVRAASSRYAETQSYTIRGFQAQTVLFNGLPGLTDEREPFLDGIERVEVFEGPSTLVNGASQEVGGTINLVPKRATDTPVRDLTLGFVNDAQGEGHVDLGQRFGPGGDWGARLTGGVRGGDTPLDHQLDRAANGALALDYRGERLRASIDASYQDRRLLANLSEFTVSPGIAIPHAPDLSTDIFDRSSYYRRTNSIELGAAEYDLLRHLTLFAAIGHDHSFERYRGPYSPQITGEDGTTTVLVIPYVRGLDTYVGRVGARAMLDTGPVHHELTVSAEAFLARSGGGYALDEPLTTNLYAPVALAPEVPFHPDPARTYNERDITKSAVIADAASALDGRVTLIAGVRWVTIATLATDPATGAVTTGYRASRTTPAVALLVKPLPRLTIYGNYIQALQQGPVAPVGTVNANQPFPPTVAEQEEVGAKYELGRAAGVTLAAFRITEPSGLTDAATNRFSVDGEQRNRGLELTAFGQVAPHLRLLGGASLLDAVQQRTQDGLYDGRRAPGVPDWQVNAGAEWDVAGRRGLTLTGRVLYTSREYDDAANTQSIPGWARLDLGARYTASVGGRPLVFRANVENVTGVNYWASAIGSELALGVPRTALLSVTRGF